MSSKPKSTRRLKVSGESRIRRKNLNIDQHKLDRLVEILDAHSETEAIDRVIDEALLRHDLVEGVRRIAGKGELENYFPGGWSEGLEE